MMTDMNKEQFARCPFCGKSETLTIEKASDAFAEPDDCGDPMPYMHTESYSVICDASKPDGPGGCGGCGGYFPSEDEAIAAWNRREEAVTAQPPAQAEPAPAPAGEYPPIPNGDIQYDVGNGLAVSWRYGYSKALLKKIIDADRAQRPAHEVRLLTVDESYQVCAHHYHPTDEPGSWKHEEGLAEAIQRKFCKVNGLTIKEQS